MADNEQEFAQYFEVHGSKEQPQLIEARFEGGDTNVLVRHPDVTVLAAKLASYFKDAGGTNYVELTINTPEYGDLIITVQRKLGKTPHQLRVEAEAREHDFTPEELRTLKLAMTLATDEVSRRKQPHQELLGQLDSMYQKLRNMGA